MKFGKKSPKRVSYFTLKAGTLFSRLVSAGRHGQYFNQHNGTCQHSEDGTACHACRNPMMAHNLRLDRQGA